MKTEWLRTQENEGGRHGGMDASDFVALVQRNLFRTDVRFIRRVMTQAGPTQAPKDTFSIVIGPMEAGLAYNVPVGSIPEYSLADADTGAIVHRGWRALLQFLLCDYVLDPQSEELERVLGPRQFHEAIANAIKEPLNSTRAY